MEEKLALNIYQSLDEKVLEILDEYAEDFFTNLSDLNELGKWIFLNNKKRKHYKFLYIF